VLQLVIAFLPWIILAVLGDRWFELALLLALAAAAVTTARQFLSRSPKILDTVTFAFFVFAAVGVIGFGWMVLGIYMTLLVNVMLMAIAWGSLLAGTPFTIQYAREQVPQELWRAPLFIRINQYITAVWGLDFFLSALVSLYRHATGATGLASQYAWVLFSVGAALFTGYFPGWYRARALRPAGSGGASRPSSFR
jgi:all-trans-retinol 13,14-reductase